MVVSQRRACKILKQPRSTQRYEAKGASCDEKRLLGRIHELVRRHPRYGYRRIWALLRREGWRVNRKRIYRPWRQEGLKVPQKQRKRRHLGHRGNSCVRRRAEHKDHIWRWDFIHDRTTSGRPLKWLAITDEYTRECLALEVDRSITADKVLDILMNLFMTQGLPHKRIARILGISENTHREYLREYEEGGVERLKTLRFQKPQSELAVWTRVEHGPPITLDSGTL